MNRLVLVAVFCALLAISHAQDSADDHMENLLALDDKLAEKRSPSAKWMRFGKRSPNAKWMRFGKRIPETKWMRFGKRGGVELYDEAEY